MPTVLRADPYRFFFYAGDRDEPLHVHVERDDKIAKFWLDPIRLQSATGFSRAEMGRIQKLIGEHRTELVEAWMSISAVEVAVPNAENATITDDTLSVDLSDGRTISVPLAWFPRLLHATLKERRHWRLIGKGHGIHWEDIDEEISVEGLLAGRPSGESQRSFKEWQGRRASRLTKRSAGGPLRARR